ncbi:hypothetical protein HZH66_005374 [Vespula vulgaris]|uniref:Uncharacterized protein n=1 Tax=Vespula vulgaris TaxID=7454 RepID=A0A834KBX7_VESVU|nr:hypothetical protein HZH66_005374 [Vespula vulgaris]
MDKRHKVKDRRNETCKAKVMLRGDFLEPIITSKEICRSDKGGIINEEWMLSLINTYSSSSSDGDGSSSSSSSSSNSSSSGSSICDGDHPEVPTIGQFLPTQ